MAAAAGTAMFRKDGSGRPPTQFPFEAAGLRWLRDSGTVPVVHVYEVDASHILVARLRTVPATATAADRFGSRLAAMHDSGADCFGSGPVGWSGDGFIGNAPLPLHPEATWSAFYAEQRLLYYAREAYDADSLSTRGLRAIERLASLVQAGTFDDGAPPARLHGDLWAGNVLFCANASAPEGEVTLIDPAAHGGHRITDLAMLSLFGCPHLARILAAYESTSRWLPTGWRELIGLHQVHPLLVHAVLFGGGYGSAAEQAAAAYL